MALVARFSHLWPLTNWWHSQHPLDFPPWTTTSRLTSLPSWRRVNSRQNYSKLGYQKTIGNRNQLTQLHSYTVTPKGLRNGHDRRERSRQSWFGYQLISADADPQRSPPPLSDGLHKLRKKMTKLKSQLISSFNLFQIHLSILVHYMCTNLEMNTLYVVYTSA